MRACLQHFQCGVKRKNDFLVEIAEFFRMSVIFCVAVPYTHFPCNAFILNAFMGVCIGNAVDSFVEQGNAQQRNMKRIILTICMMAASVALADQTITIDGNTTTVSLAGGSNTVCNITVTESNDKIEYIDGSSINNLTTITLTINDGKKTQHIELR